MGPAIIALVIAGVFLILGLIMLQSVRDADIITKANSASVLNETIATVTETGETLVGGTAPAGTCTVATITNETSGTVIGSGNYTVTNCVVAGSGNTDGHFNNTGWNVTYTYTYGDEAYVGGNLSVTGLGSFGGFWEIIVLAIVITIVIGLLLLAFGRQAR